MQLFGHFIISALSLKLTSYLFSYIYSNCSYVQLSIVSSQMFIFNTHMSKVTMQMIIVTLHMPRIIISMC